MRRRLVLLAAAAAALWLAPGALAAGWCGTGETATDQPDLNTGRQIHAIVALPADSPDTFPAVANRLADDVNSMTGWWLGQDPTRQPRFDIAAYPGGTCVEISFVRLPDPGSAYQGASLAFIRVQQQLYSAGFTSPYKKYYVYYDGPSVQEFVCGTGGENVGMPSYAVVWLQGCAGVYTDYVGTHELLHALGALPQGAPNWCRQSPIDGRPDTGHPCDSPTDILYPETTGQPLSQAVLDFNHDDYYAHGGTWVDLQDSPWLHRLDVPQVPVTVSLSGAGTVSSDVPGILCTVACTTQWDQGSTLTLQAEGAATTRFLRWQGSCTGAAGCSLTTAQPSAVTAVFGPLRIPVRVATTGKGKVVCTPGCSKSFPAGDPLRLRAVPAKGWRFRAWSGACKGTRLTCSPATDFAVSARATFAKLPALKKKR